MKMVGKRLLDDGPEDFIELAHSLFNHQGISPGVRFRLKEGDPLKHYVTVKINGLERMDACPQCKKWRFKGLTHDGRCKVKVTGEYDLQTRQGYILFGQRRKK